MATKKIAVFVGSLRKESYNRKMAAALIELGGPALTCEILEIGNLPLYNQDFDDENRPPKSWTDFRERVREFDGFLFVTPEYNRSVPGVLKNALDVGSRPPGKSVWNAKPGAVVTVSPGALGGFGANHHLRQSMVFLNVPMMPSPEAYIGHCESLFDAAGRLVEGSTREYMGKFMKAYTRWLETFEPA